MSHSKIMQYVSQAISGTSSVKAPLILTTNDLAHAQRVINGAASEHFRRIVRFNHPVAPVARGRLWLATRESDSSASQEPKTLTQAFHIAGMSARRIGRPILCLAPSLHDWKSEDLRDLIYGVREAREKRLPIFFVGFCARGFAEKMQENYYFARTTFQFMTLNRVLDYS